MSKRQLWVIALVPINEIDSNSMAGGATDYTIKTQQTFVDGLISAVTGGIITIRTVTVTK
jgi:hypothetical protein